MTDADPPFFLFDGLDLTLFDSLDDLVISLEGIDVDSGAYQAFDAAGRVVRLGARGVTQTRFTVEIGEVVIESIEEVSHGLEQLRKLLKDHLIAMDQGIDREATLADLVSLCRSVHDS